MRIRSKIVAAALLAVVATSTPFLFPGVPGWAVAQTVVDVPPRDRVSRAITNYTALRPQIATAGRLLDGGVAELKGLGFTAILDLRGPQEGTEAERSAVAAAGMRYFNIPVTTATVNDAQIVEFARLVEDKSNYPLLIHCQSANRVGGLWTLYRAIRGAPFATAVAEGRTIGLTPDRENAVRAQLGQPPMGR